MNYGEAIAKIEEEYVDILNYEEVIKELTKYTTNYNQEFASITTQLAESLDYQKIVNQVKDKAIANIKKSENEDIDFEVVKSNMINSAVIKIIDEISFIYIKKREELHDLMQVKKDETNCQAAKTQTGNTKLLSNQEVIDTITQEFRGTLNYEKMINKVIELYTKSASSVDLKTKMAEEIKEYVKPLDYQKIVDEVKEEIIVKINQNSGLNYQDIVSDMQNLIKIRIENKIVYEVAKCNQELKEKCEELVSESKKQEAKLGVLPESCTKSSNPKRNSRGQTTKSLSQKVSDKFGKLSETLRDYEVHYKSLKRGESLANHETKEGIISKLQETIIKIIDSYQRCPNYSESYELVPRVFNIINSNIGSDPIWKGFVINNFSRIIQFGFKNEEPLEDLIKLIEKIANKLKEQNSDKLPLHDAMESHYLQVVEQHREICGQLGKLKQKCSNERLYQEFYVFIDFIHSSKKEKGEQDREKELQRQKAEGELLEGESKKTGTRPKQPQPKRKKKRSKNSSNNKTVIKDKKLDELEAQSVKEEVFFEDEEVKELREELKELIALLFSDERSKQFEDKVNKAIEDHEEKLKTEASSIDDEKIKDLYVIKSDFHLRRTILSISHYNKQYGKIIKQTKNDFGTNRFSKKDNKYITSHLTDIALRVQHIDADLKEVLSVLDKMIPLVYKDYYQESDDGCLKIISEENFEWLNRFLDHLKALGEWHSNKINYVQEINIKNGKKTAQERKEEKEALKAIESCVGSLDRFISKSDYVQDLNNNQSVKSDKESPLEYYGPYQPWQYYGPHQQWCALSNVNIEEVHKLPEEVRSCSC